MRRHVNRRELVLKVQASAHFSTINAESIALSGGCCETFICGAVCGVGGKFPFLESLVNDPCSTSTPHIYHRANWKPSNHGQRTINLLSSFTSIDNILFTRVSLPSRSCGATGISRSRRRRLGLDPLPTDYESQPPDKSTSTKIPLWRPDLILFGFPSQAATRSLPTTATPTRTPLLPTLLPRNLHHPPRPHLPLHRNSLSNIPPNHLLAQRANPPPHHLQRRKLDLPLRENVLRRPPAQTPLPPRGRHVRRRTDPQRRQRARLEIDQRLGTALCEGGE